VLCVCSSVVRRPSLHEKDAMSAKDAREEAQHVLEMMAAVKDEEEDVDMQPDLEKVCFTFLSSSESKHIHY